MNKKEIIDELHKMGYEVKEETLVRYKKCPAC